MFGLLTAVLLLAVGMALDYTRVVSERERGQIALDAATLGYVRQYVNTQNKPTVTEFAEGLAKANDGSNLDWTWKFQDAIVSNTEIRLTATGTARFQNYILPIFGFDHVDLNITSTARLYSLGQRCACTRHFLDDAWHAACGAAGGFEGVLKLDLPG